MKLLPGWSKRLASAKAARVEASQTYRLKKCPDYYARQVRFLESKADVRDMIAFAHQRPLSHIGLDTEFRYRRPGVMLEKQTTVYDPRSIEPLLLSLALSEPCDQETGILYPFVVDLRDRELVAELEALHRLPAPFVGHNLKVELFCLWQLGLSAPATLWDTFIAEKARYLGVNHTRYGVKRGAEAADEARVREEATEREGFSLSLVATCQRYGVAYAFECTKTRLQESFLSHAVDHPFTGEQIDYAAEDALAAARLFDLQAQATLQQGLQFHLITIEMPWVRTNARMIWKGVRVDPEKRARLRASAAQQVEALERALADLGLANANSHLELKAFFGKLGILEHFRRDGKYSFDKENIKTLSHLHTAVDMIRRLRRTQDVLSHKLLDERLVGADDRVHADLIQLGAHTGRQTSRHPNILAVPRELRPVIVPKPGFGIGEVDLSQIEPGIAGAVYGDERLVELFNSGDVYSAMAQEFFREELGEAACTLPSRDFKRRYPELRKQMKVCTLGIVYGLTAHGLAGQLRVSEIKARRLQARFMGHFPTLDRRRAETQHWGALRGFAVTQTGLRRHRARAGAASSWEANWLTNHPVQGSAAAAFKSAGNRLDRLYKPYEAKLLIPLHDSFIFEAPVDVLEEVAHLTARVLCEEMELHFPELRPRVDVNIAHPQCWNKDGDVGEWDHWGAGGEGLEFGGEDS